MGSGCGAWASALVWVGDALSLAAAAAGGEVTLVDRPDVHPPKVTEWHVERSGQSRVLLACRRLGGRGPVIVLPPPALPFRRLQATVAPVRHARVHTRSEANRRRRVHQPARVVTRVRVCCVVDPRLAQGRISVLATFVSSRGRFTPRTMHTREERHERGHRRRACLLSPPLFLFRPFALVWRRWSPAAVACRGADCAPSQTAADAALACRVAHTPSSAGQHVLPRHATDGRRPTGGFSVGGHRRTLSVGRSHQPAYLRDFSRVAPTRQLRRLQPPKGAAVH